MFTFFATNTQNPSPMQADNTIFSFLFLMLSMLSLSPLVAAQRGGGGFGGGRGGIVGGYGYGYSGSGGGDCDNNCLTTLALGGGFGGLLLFVCIVVIMCNKNSRETQIDNSLILGCPYDNPQHWLISSEVTIPISIEYSDMIEHLKLHPSMLNNLWEGLYTEPGIVGKFNPKLSFNWNEEKNLMEFKTIEDEQDDYGDYRIINGMFSFENDRFVAHKEYFRPSQQTVPYTIVQAGHIEFVIKNDQLCLTASGSWYSTYNNSVQGAFEYSKTIQELTLANKCESYGTFATP